jgi:hypothetical protein
MVGTGLARVGRIVTVVGAALVLAAVPPTRVLAWGAESHRTVAAIALRLLPPRRARRLTVSYGSP